MISPQAAGGTSPQAAGTSTCPRLVVGGVSSGVGKTTLSVGLARALRRRGLRVAVFKCGPDYLDPTYLSRASGQQSHNLDGWMMGQGAVLDTFTAAAAGADVSLIEGVMGLFDGASAESDEGSTAQIAKWLAAPVLLVADAGGMARSIAALARGFVEFDPELNVAALACNRVGSARHLDLLRAALASAPPSAGRGGRALPLLGGLGKQAELAFAERHLGLHSADRESVPEALLERWADQVDRGLDVEALLQLARSAPALPLAGAAPALPSARVAGEPVARTCRIGVALDAAFHFYYADNLRRLEQLGAELSYFSPLEARELPAVDGLYLGGGYPELHAARLSQNVSLRAAIRQFADQGGPIYAECGGLMYLVEAIRTTDGQSHPMLGCLPGEAVVRERLVALGYVEVETRAPTLLGPAGLRFRGHQFRYSELLGAPANEACTYVVQWRRGGEPLLEGYRSGNVLASYVHAHWASNPQAAAGFVQACAQHARRSS
ncbi:MAG: Cobyrinic acid a,c-diamide synthase [Pseudomonadota bacterium]